ncbi:unnamed protein product [Linum trigynum]|uniref:RING-type E3 ubiquitin transferase n=1 Tax=Linum trigynum TaxID=586398 RepID=A0AAV2GRJ8_9ROSI
MRHRKLFPSQTSNTTSLNCSGFCDPACPLNCYPLPDDVYVLPPPPPADQGISPLVIVIVSILAAVFLLVSYYVIFGKSFLERRGFRQQLRGEEGESGGGGGENDPNANVDEQPDVLLGRNQVHHPIWYIATVGLPQSLIDSITVCKFNKGERLIEGTECSVCLSEFQDGDTLRLLPKCSHAFHVSCIDTWLRSHTNCPLCRAHIVADLESGRDNSDPPSPITTARAEADADVGVDSVRVGAAAAENDDGEADNSTGGFEGYFGDSRKRVKKLRKSSSMDFLAANLAVCDEPTESVGSGTSSDSGSFRQPSCSSSIAQYLRKSPVSMKRSNSCGGRFFLTRINRSQSLILPL